MSEIISSVHNPQVKRLHRLTSRKGREEAGAFLVEGVHLVEEAFASGMPVLTVIYDAERPLDAAVEAWLDRRPEVRRLAVTSAVIDKLSETKTPQGVLAEVKLREHAWERWREEVGNKDFLILMLDEVQDPGNLGTIIRTADAAGIDAVVLGEGCADPYNGKVVRATMGSLFRMPVLRGRLAEIADRLRSEGARLLATAVSGDSRSYDEPLYQGKVAMIIGNEARGVSAELAAMADDRVHIPLYGRAESLNAAVAAAVLMYEAVRQRRTAR